MSVATLHNVRIGYDLVGTAGDPTVLLHGSWLDRRVWSAVAHRLRSSLQVLSVDRRGYGESRGPPGPSAADDDVADLVALLESLDFSPVHLLALSYAGAVALRVAADRPELVRSLVLHEPPLYDLADPGRSEVDGALAAVEYARSGPGGSEAAGVREAFARFGTDPEGLDALPPGLREVARQALGAWVREQASVRGLGPLLSGLDLPVLVTVGGGRPAWLAATSEHVAGRLRNGQFQRLDGAGSFPPLREPDRFAGLAVDFLLERHVPSA